jgi:UPF0176 protein
MTKLNILKSCKADTSPYWVLAFYHFVAIENPHAEVTAQKNFFADRDITSRIYISENGINGQMSGAKADAEAYIKWMVTRPEFSNVCFKVHPHHEQAFPRATVKYRPKLVAIDEQVDLNNRGEHVSPQRWKEMLIEKQDHWMLLDVRNEYEWKVGRFEGAELPPCNTFREFTAYADALKAKSDPKETPVMMYCTGGIRCELYSAVLKDRGFEKVYQLDGGIIGYGLEEGNTHWQGKLFVFDDRLTVPISEKENASVIGSCHHCGKPNETYYNCANTDCNNLFLACQACAQQYIGCCGTPCMEAPRRRPFQADTAHKPFRKLQK